MGNGGECGPEIPKTKKGMLPEQDMHSVSPSTRVKFHNVLQEVGPFTKARWALFAQTATGCEMRWLTELTINLLSAFFKLIGLVS
jgi:hypothetical protein